MGSFIALYGIANSRKLIAEALRMRRHHVDAQVPIWIILACLHRQVYGHNICE